MKWVMRFNSVDRNRSFRLRSKFAVGFGSESLWNSNHVAHTICGIFLRAPGAMAIMVGLSLFLQLGGAMAYLIILPEEWDASFNKALPILIEGPISNQRISRESDRY